MSIGMLDTLMSKQVCRWVIEGVKEDGRPFRPSDWIERISTTVATFGRDHRLHYSTSVRPLMIKGQKCLVVDQALEQENPVAFDYVMGFARANGLRVHEECSEEADGAHQP